MKTIIFKIIKWYFVYHIIVDFCFLVVYSYWYWTESNYIWYRRIVNEPFMLIDVLLLFPLYIVYIPFELLFS